MPSRKRNKGKERRAKRAATEAEKVGGDRTTVGEFQPGCVAIPAQDHAVSKFMNRYCVEYNHCRNSLKAMMKIFE